MAEKNTKCRVCGASDFRVPPHKEIEGTVPLIMYFGSQEDRDDFCRAIEAAYPGLTPHKADQ